MTVNPNQSSRRGSLLVGLLLTLLLTSCASDRLYPDGYVPLSLDEIVASATRGHLRTPLRLEPALRRQLEGFLETKDEIRTRSELKAGWQALGPPASDIEIEPILDDARDDGSWDIEAEKAGYEPSQVPEIHDVRGFFLGITRLITGVVE